MRFIINTTFCEASMSMADVGEMMTFNVVALTIRGKSNRDTNLTPYMRKMMSRVVLAGN